VQRAVLKRRHCDMVEMARGVMAEALASMPQRRVEVIWGKLPPAFADPTLLRQVWQNLIGNALKYSAKRETAVIEIGARTVAGETEYYVTDNGAGFDMSQADRLFGVFQRFHAQSQFEGTGIGLANVHKIVQRHGGQISAEAEVDRGATFRFTIGSILEGVDPHESAVFVGDGMKKR
jgi:light-regulated signal transduction histidine kinase (bacteriophytochrome)